MIARAKHRREVCEKASPGEYRKRTVSGPGRFIRVISPSEATIVCVISLVGSSTSETQLSAKLRSENVERFCGPATLERGVQVESRASGHALAARTASAFPAAGGTQRSTLSGMRVKIVCPSNSATRCTCCTATASLWPCTGSKKSQRISCGSYRKSLQKG